MKINIINVFKKYKAKSDKYLTGSKVDLKSLKDIPLKEFHTDLIREVDEKVIFYLVKNSIRYDYILHKKKSNKLFVVFSGYADRKKLAPPVFQRWKWSDRFPGSVLYVADPALYLNDTLSLAWYLGDSQVDYLENIAEMVCEVAKNLNVKNENIVSYGSSGGGYAAIRLGHYIQNMSCVAINPQTEIKRYSKPTVNKFLKVCFDSSYNEFDFNSYGERFNLLNKSEALDNNKIIIAQNILDETHFYNHYLPYCNVRGFDGSNPIKSFNFKTILFSHKDGHAAAETSAVFDDIMVKLRR